MKLNVLVVEDDYATLELYVKEIQKHFLRLRDENEFDLHVDGLHEVSDAIAKIRAVHIDILIIDWMMPFNKRADSGGQKLIDESKKNDPLRPIIIITGYGTMELVKSALAQGIFDFIEKSITAIDELIKAIIRAVKLLNDRAIRIGNPFNPMTSSPRVFGGREEQLEFFNQRLMRSLQLGNCEHFMVIGNWGIGKSALLTEFKKISNSRGYIVSMVPQEPMQIGSTTLEAARSILEGIIRGLPYPIDQFNNLIKYFKSLGVSIAGTGFQIGIESPKVELSAQAFLYDGLLNLWEDLAGKTEILILLLDDTDNLINIPEIFIILKNILSSNKAKEMGILLGASMGHNNWLKLTSQKFDHPTARFFFYRTYLDNLNPDEAKHMIIDSISSTGVVFENDIINRVIEHTAGHPYEIQVLCYYLFNQQLNRVVNHDVWSASLREAIQNMGKIVFDNWLAQCRKEEVLILKAAAHVNSIFTLDMLRELTYCGKLPIANEAIENNLQQLENKSYFYQKNIGEYAFSDPMFRSYLNLNCKL
jgi:CheY-like chemotaxis protein